MIDTAVVVYGKPGCQQCRLTVQALDRAKIPYVYHDTEAEPEAKKWVADMGYLGVPVTVDGFEHWQGLQPDRLRKAIETRRVRVEVAQPAA